MVRVSFTFSLSSDTLVPFLSSHASICLLVGLLELLDLLRDRKDSSVACIDISQAACSLVLLLNVGGRCGIVSSESLLIGSQRIAFRSV